MPTTVQGPPTSEKTVPLHSPYSPLTAKRANTKLSTMRLKGMTMASALPQTIIPSMNNRPSPITMPLIRLAPEMEPDTSRPATPPNSEICSRGIACTPRSRPIRPCRGSGSSPPSTANLGRPHAGVQRRAAPPAGILDRHP